MLAPLAPLFTNCIRSPQDNIYVVRMRVTDLDRSCFVNFKHFTRN